MHSGDQSRPEPPMRHRQWSLGAWTEETQENPEGSKSRAAWQRAHMHIQILRQRMEAFPAIRCLNTTSDQ